MNTFCPGYFHRYGVFLVYRSETLHQNNMRNKEASAKMYILEEKSFKYSVPEYIMEMYFYCAKEMK